MPATYEVEVTAAALADVERLHAFLFPKNPEAADRLLASFEAALDRLSSMPGTGRRRTSDRDVELRELVARVGRGSYIIRYEVRTDRIVIARIHHGRADR